MIISTIFLGIWGYSEISIYGNFIKIWFNGSIRTSFTESYIDGLPHVWGSPTKIDKNKTWSSVLNSSFLFAFNLQIVQLGKS